MAQELKLEYSISIDTTKLLVKDVSGEYEVTSNPGGWGTPNPNLSESCLVMLAVRKASTGDVLLTPITPSVPFVYDNTATNDVQKTFEVAFDLDSVFEITLLRIPVSLDDANYEGGEGAIENDDFYYYNNKIYKRAAGIGVEVTDYMDLLEDNSIVSETCSDALTPLLALKRNTLYKEYRVSRNTDCDDAEPLFKQIQELDTDIQGLYNTFWSNLQVEAQNQIEDLIDRYEIKANA